MSQILPTHSQHLTDTAALSVTELRESLNRRFDGRQYDELDKGEREAALAQVTQMNHISRRHAMRLLQYASFPEQIIAMYESHRLPCRAMDRICSLSGSARQLAMRALIDEANWQSVPGIVRQPAGVTAITRIVRTIERESASIGSVVQAHGEVVDRLGRAIARLTEIHAAAEQGRAMFDALASKRSLPKRPGRTPKALKGRR